MALCELPWVKLALYELPWVKFLSKGLEAGPI